MQTRYSQTSQNDLLSTVARHSHNPCGLAKTSGQHPRNTLRNWLFFYTFMSLGWSQLQIPRYATNVLDSKRSVLRSAFVCAGKIVI